MAVSSSIGSNIFDILVGLPIPWIFAGIANLADGKPDYTKLASDGTLSLSIIILICMLAAVIITIAACKWKMSKKLGAVMFCLVSPNALPPHASADIRRHSCRIALKWLRYEVRLLLLCCSLSYYLLVTCSCACACLAPLLVHDRSFIDAICV